MELLHPRCAGVDVHKDMVVVCMRVQEGRTARNEVKTFGTTTKELLALADWLLEQDCTHIAMEATGVYWRPVWHVLSTCFELVLANAMHIKAVPGRKSDVNDATWIADLLAHGLIRPSFVPPTPVQDFRALMRTRKQLVRERAQHVQRLQKTLEDTNIKISSAVSDITGTSGRAILRALIAGESDPEKLLGVTTGRLKASRSTLLDALKGRVRDGHRFLLKLHLDQVEALERAIESIDKEVGACLGPFRDAVDHLKTMPGLSDVAAQTLVSEIGDDMSRFPSAAHLVSWAGMCPRSDESAGKRRSTRLRKGAPWLKATLIQCAWAAIRTKDSYFKAQFHRIKARRGPMKAIIAVAASMLTSAYYMLRDSADYVDLGPDHFETINKHHALKRLLKKLNNLGYQAQLSPISEPGVSP